MGQKGSGDQVRVDIQGVIYETVGDAAEAYNVTEQTIRRVICEGREDTLKVKRKGCKRGRPEPFTMEGVTWPNQKAANTALGLPYNYITQSLNKGSIKGLNKIAATVRAYKENAIDHNNSGSLLPRT